MAEQINKTKLNELLGIKEGQTFDDYLNEGSGSEDVSDTQSIIDQTTQLIEETRNKVEEIDQKFNENLQVVDETQKDIQQNGLLDSNGSASARIDSLINVDNAFRSIEDLVDTTKQMIANVYGIISSCDVLDSETVSAAASLIGESRQLISEYTGLFKQRIKFFDNCKLEMLKQQHKIELLERKYQLDKDREEWKMKNQSQPAQANVVDGQETPPGMVSFDTKTFLDELMAEDKA